MEPQKPHVSNSHFFLSFFLLPKPQRSALKAVYAFCRESDDRVDEPGSKKERAARLREWRAELERCYKGKARTAVARELSGVVREYHIPKKYFDDLLDGMEMDLTKDRYRTFAELYRYCYRAAGVVGLICLRIFGVPENRGKEYAVAQGVAFQLTNILRDVKTDLERGRIYLPQEDFRRFGYRLNDFKQGRVTPEGRRFLAFQVARCRDFYDQIARTMPREESGKLRASRAMAGVYWQILTEIEIEPARIFRGKVRVPKWKQAWVALMIMFS